MKVFKFGGASVKDADSVRNVAQILKKETDNHLIVVVSAMGKTTNLLERLIDAYWKNESTTAIFESFKSFHLNILKDLFEDRDLSSFDAINTHFEYLKQKLNTSSLYSNLLKPNNEIFLSAESILLQPTIISNQNLKEQKWFERLNEIPNIAQKLKLAMKASKNVGRELH